MAFALGIREFKSSFFDASAILKEMDAFERKTLSRFGSFARQRMKTSLKYAKEKSSPGKPPHVHKDSGYTRKTTNKKTGETKRQAASPLRDLVFFAYDASAHSVVVGPARFGAGGGIVPGLLERGGPGVLTDPTTGGLARGVWAPRPFVKPAGEAEAQAGKFLRG